MLKFRVIESGDEYKVETRFIDRVVSIPTTIRFNLYNSNNQIKSAEELAAMGIEVVTYPDRTQDDDDRDYVTSLYAIPELGAVLKARVIQYKNYLTEIGITDYSFINTEVVEAGVKSTFDSSDSQLEYSTRILTCFNDITVNLGGIFRLRAASDGISEDDPEYSGIPYDTWELIPKLIKWLPVEEATTETESTESSEPIAESNSEPVSPEPTESDSASTESTSEGSTETTTTE